MDLRSNQRVQAQPRSEAASAHYEAATPASTRRSARSGKFNNRKIWLPVVVLLLLGLAGAILWFTGGGALSSVDRGKYQAVFLTNGQVYFGKITGITADVVTLSDIYYLQQQTSVQNQDDKDKQAQAQNQMSLAKLGKELHGPQDRMYIERSQVLFWENLKDAENSQVVKTIEQEKQQNKNN